MSQQKPTPRLYLTEKMCRLATQTALRAFKGYLKSIIEQPLGLHVTIIATTIRSINKLNILGGDDDTFLPFPVYNFSYGEKDWKLNYYDIATKEAMRLWRCRNQNQICSPKQTHQPEQSLASCWGGVNKQGITVSCYGPKAHFSQLFAEITANTIIALVHDKYGTLPENTGSIFF